MSEATLARVAVAGGAALEYGFEAECDQSEKREERGEGESGGDTVFIVEDLDLQGNRVCEAADMAGDDGNGTELAHPSRIGEQHAAQQRPFRVRQRDGGEGLQTAGAQCERGFF